MLRHFLIPIFAMMVLVIPAQSLARFKYTELQLKDFDEMSNQIQDRIKKSQRLLRAGSDEGEPNEEAVELLRQALLFALSRPNPDNLLSKILPELRKELSQLQLFESSIQTIVTNAISGLKNDKLPSVYRSTSLFVLENVLSEFRPEAREKASFRKIFESIRDAKIEIPKEVSKELKMKSMISVESPSEKANRILKTK